MNGIIPTQGQQARREADKIHTQMKILAKGLLTTMVCLGMSIKHQGYPCPTQKYCDEFNAIAQQVREIAEDTRRKK